MQLTMGRFGVARATCVVVCLAFACGFVAAQPSLRQPSAQPGSQNAVDHSDGAEDLAGRGQRIMSITKEERRHPHRNSAEGEHHHCHAQSRGPIGGIVRQPGKCRAIRSNGQRFGSAPSWLAQKNPDQQYHQGSLHGLRNHRRQAALGCWTRRHYRT